MSASNLATLAEEALQRLGEQKSLVFEGQEVTNAQTMASARRLQRAFGALGMEKGRIGALCMVNHPLVYPAFQGLFRTGGAAVPVMFQLQARELKFILEDTRSHLVVTDEANLSKVREATQDLDFVRWIVVRGLEGEPEGRVVSLESLLEEDEQQELPAIQPEDLGLLLYTSGTTGVPKGAMLSHANLIASAEASSAASELDDLEAPRVSISAMPMAHIFGVGVMNGGYLTPAKLAGGYMVQMSWFEPIRFMELIQQHRCSSMPAVPTMLALLLHHPRVDEFDLQSLEDVVCGASPLPVEVARAFAEKFSCRVREIYGMTESTGIGSANRPSDPFRPGSAGRAYPGTEVRIVSEEGDPLPSGESGEIALRGPSVMVGYLNRPDATAETVKDGWLHTGDVGRLDEEGFLYIVDRKKDMIIRGGENIYPAEVESVLYEHSSVAEAAIVGIPDEIYGESVVAFVVLKAGEEATPQDLIAFVRDQTMPFKAPSRVVFKDELPKSGVGKILRRVLRDEAAAEAQ